MKGELPNYHLIVVSYLGATNNRGSRMKLTSLRFNDSVRLNYDNSFKVTQSLKKNKRCEFIQNFLIFKI